MITNQKLFGIENPENIGSLRIKVVGQKNPLKPKQEIPN
jgi:hypothetical protein